jgi:hypothetical protein
MRREIPTKSIDSLNLLKSNDYFMYHIQKLYFLLTHLLLICTNLRISSDYLPIGHRLIGFCDGRGIWLLSSKKLIFQYHSD